MAENSEKKKRGPGRPFPPGVSGNAGGRPRSTLSKTLALLLEEKLPDVDTTNELEIARKIVELARAGDKDMIEFIWDRLEGKAPQSLDFTSGGKPLPAASNTVNLGKLTDKQLLKLVEVTR